MFQKLFNQKKADVFERSFWIVLLIFLVLVLLVNALIIRMALNMHLETKHTEAALLMARFLHSPEGISLVDPISGRVVTGVIDLANLNDTRLDNGIVITNNDRLSAGIEVYEYITDKTSKKTEKFVKQAIFNKQFFDVYEPMADAFYNVGGIGGVAKFEKTYPIILIDKKGQKKLGNVKFKVIIPKSAK